MACSAREGSKMAVNLPGRLRSHPSIQQGAVVAPDALQAMLPKSSLERYALARLQAAGLTPPARQYRFDPIRRWAFDFAWPERRVSVEIQGGIYAKTRLGHSSGSGIEAGMEKHNAAQLAGWIVLAYSDHGINDGSMVEDVRRALEMRSHATTD